MINRAAVLVLILGLAVVGCGPDTNASPSASPSSTARPTATVASTPTAMPTTTAAAPTSSPTPVASIACDTLPQTGLLPSDRLTNVGLVQQPGRDIVRFTFGEGSLTPVGAATGTLGVASPPFTEASSGLPIDLRGQHALQVVFKGMSLQNDAGEPTYTGQRAIEGVGTSAIVRQAVIFDESEGQIGWYLGYDGAGCVSLTRVGGDILLAVAAGPAS